MKNKKLYLFAFVLFLIIVNKFFEYKPLLDFSIYLNIAVFFILLIYTFKKFFYNKGVFIGPIKYIILSFFVAVIPSVLIWDQELFRSFLAIAPYSYFLLYFFLIDAKIDRNSIINTILAFAYISLILYIYQFMYPEDVFFGYKEEIIEDRGLLRVGFPGEGFLFFALFYYLNKIGQKFNIKYLLLLVPFLWMLLVQVTRMFILGFGLIAIYHFMLKAKIKYRVLTVVAFFCCYLFYINSENVIIKGIRESTTNDIEQKDDYIRLMEAEYFLYQFSNNNATYFLGNGAIDFKSTYGKKFIRLGEDNYFFLEDIGILKGYVLFGVLFIVGYLLIYIRSFKIQLPYDQLYLKYYVWMMLVLSFTTRAPADAGFGAVFVIVLYLFDLNYLKQNKSGKIIKRFNYKRLNQI